MTTSSKLSRAYQDSNGIWRWRSNDRVLFEDTLEECGCDLDTIIRCTEVRQAEDAVSLAEYREAMKDHVPSDEEMYEMRAAFGPGETVVNVITGQVTQL